MKSTKIFITFTFLFAFAFQVSAQTEKPKIIWENLQKIYQDFSDVKPLVKNNLNKPIYLQIQQQNVFVLVFDETVSEWKSSKYAFKAECGNRPPPRFSKIKSGLLINISNQIDWAYELLGANGQFRSQNAIDWEEIPDYKVGKKYKLRLYFSVNKKGDSFFSESPEFLVRPAK